MGYVDHIVLSFFNPNAWEASVSAVWEGSGQNSFWCFAPGQIFQQYTALMGMASLSDRCGF